MEITTRVDRLDARMDELAGALAQLATVQARTEEGIQDLPSAWRGKLARTSPSASLSFGVYQRRNDPPPLQHRASVSSGIEVGQGPG